MQQILPPPVEEDASVIETFVDGPLGVNFVGGNLHITFYTIRLDHRVAVQAPASLPQVRHVALRLVMPLPGAVDLRATIENMVQLLRQQGIMQSTSVMAGPLTRQ
jgi:hypothetical protein